MSDAPKPGTVLGGKFRVERVLGEGGMGVVVAATHLTLGQLVALKFMLPHALDKAENVARFEREARAAVRLRSEHVARVSDVGHLDSGAPYMVMEFLEGEDLDRILDRQGAFPIEVAVDYLLQACEAVGEAHSLGIVHRDLKPKNLFLTKSATGKPLVKVLDFGISKIAGTPDDMSLTSTTQVLGSPSYMSPEQLRATRDVDHRCDIWALGTILFELLTGVVPFKAETVTQLTAMVVADPPQPLKDLRPEVPHELERAILRCLEKRREDRFQSIAELAEALAPFASHEGVSKARDVMSTTGGRSGAERTVPPPARSSGGSIRVAAMGAGTEVSWDQTQLAPGQKRKGQMSPWLPIGAIGILGGGALAFFLLRPPPPEPETNPAPAQQQTGAPAGSMVEAAAPPSASPTAGLPSAREPVNPPLESPTGGPERPAPSGFPSTGAPKRPPPSPPPVAKPSTAPSAKKPPAGAKPGGSDLPDVRD